MTANELADELMKFYNLKENTAPIQIYDLAATMLRQQQAQIEALKTFIKERTWFDVDAILKKAQE